MVASNTFQSGAVVVEDEAYQPPWVGLFGGIVLAVVVVLGARIYHNRATDSASSSTKTKSNVSTKTRKKQTSTAEKIQIGCPECARQLRVPADYGGLVRCPDCSTRFEVAPRIEADEEEPGEEQDE